MKFANIIVANIPNHFRQLSNFVMMRLSEKNLIQPHIFEGIDHRGRMSQQMNICSVFEKHFCPNQVVIKSEEDLLIPIYADLKI